MLELKFIASIAERDIDLLVLEELSVSIEFREWLSSRVFGEPIYQSKIGAWHSVSDSQHGESDLIFIFEAIEGHRTAILIENKIDAPPQPQQGNRYVTIHPPGLRHLTRRRALPTPCALGTKDSSFGVYNHTGRNSTVKRCWLGV